MTIGEVVEVEVTDIHASGAGVGRTEDGFIVLVDGLMPHCRARVEISTVRSNHAHGEEVERLPLEPEEDDAEDDATEEGRKRPTRLGSRENFWGG